MSRDLLPMASADACPACHAVHGALGDQIACGTHGHRLLFHSTQGERAVYDCPAYRCPVTITAPRNTEPAKGETMTIHHPIPQTPASEVAIQAGQRWWSKRQLAALAQLGLSKAPDEDLLVFLHRCQTTGLDPFSGQIHMIGRKMKDGTIKQTIQVGVDGYRLIAKRAANRDGKLISYGPTIWFDASGGEHKVWLQDGQPAAAMVTVYVDGAPFPGVARFKSFAQTNRDGKLIGLWETMGDHQIAKCAEVQALRRAFPHDLEGIHADIEEHQPEPEGTPWHVAATAPARRTDLEVGPADRILRARADGKSPLPSDEALEDIALTTQRHFERIGIEDADEQMNMTAALAGLDYIPDTLLDFGLTDLQRINGLLKGCDEVGQVHALTDAGDKPGSTS